MYGGKAIQSWLTAAFRVEEELLFPREPPFDSVHGRAVKQ